MIATKWGIAFIACQYYIRQLNCNGKEGQRHTVQKRRIVFLFYNKPEYVIRILKWIEPIFWVWLKKIVNACISRPHFVVVVVVRLVCMNTRGTILVPQLISTYTCINTAPERLFVPSLLLLYSTWILPILSLLPPASIITTWKHIESFLPTTSTTSHHHHHHYTQTTSASAFPINRSLIGIARALINCVFTSLPSILLLCVCVCFGYRNRNRCIHTCVEGRTRWGSTIRRISRSQWWSTEAASTPTTGP